MTPRDFMEKAVKAASERVIENNLAIDNIAREQGWGLLPGGRPSKPHSGEWGKMDTAPKNRSVILCIGGKMVIGHYDLARRAWRAEFSPDSMGSLPTPDFWTELPEPPSDGKDERL